MRLGIIGTGRIAKRAVKEIAVVRDISIAAIYNPNIEHAKGFASENGIEIACSELDKFIEVVDSIYIASPHATHYAYAKKALENGKHVICEKPLTFSEEQTKELFDIAEKKHLVLMEAIKTAYCPGFEKLCDVVESGVIGKVVDVEAAFTRLTEGETREFTDKKYGGAFTEFGTYTMLPIFRFLGMDYKNVGFKSIPVHELVSKEDQPDEADKAKAVDGYTKAYFNYANGCAIAKCGLTVKSEGQLLISGTKGYILVPSPWWLTKYFEVRYEDPRRIDKYEAEFAGDGLRYEFEEFTKRVNKTLNENIDGNISDNQIERIEAIARSRVYNSFLVDRK